MKKIKYYKYDNKFYKYENNCMYFYYSIEKIWIKREYSYKKFLDWDKPMVKEITEEEIFMELL